jgi:hypothetical protein
LLTDRGILPAEVISVVKGISRQVIVVNSPDPKLFEQAIFIIRDGQKEVTDEALLKEAKRLVSTHYLSKRNANILASAFWTGCGALMTGIVWLISALL